MQRYGGMSDIHEGVTLGEGAPSKEPLVERALGHLIDVVNRLLRYEIAAAGAVEATAERLQAPDDQLLAHAISITHRDRIDALSELVVHFGSEPAERSSPRSLFDRLRIRLRARRGEAGVLAALGDIESELAGQYHDAMEVVGFTEDERAVLGAGQAAAQSAAGRLRSASPLPLH